jgi:hypothetical protein
MMAPKAKKGFPVAPPSKTQQRKLATTMKSMAQAIAKDVGDYALSLAGEDRSAALVLRFSYNAKEKIKAKFSKEKIRQATGMALDVMEASARDAFVRSARDLVGLDLNEALRDESIAQAAEASRQQFLQWAEGLRDETLQKYIGAMSSMLTQGGLGVRAIKAQLEVMRETGIKGIERSARTQAAVFHSVLSKTRAEAAGVTKAQWVTLGDERVRESHKDRDGKVFDLAKGCYSRKDGKTTIAGVPTLLSLIDCPGCSFFASLPQHIHACFAFFLFTPGATCPSFT